MLCSSRRMGSSGRKVLWALCLLQLLGAGSAKIIWKRALRERLPERSHVEEVSAPSHRQPRADHCPPPPRTLPPGACQAVRCQADSKCLQHQRCCYNGCAYACLEAVPPPPVLDWLVQPKPRWLGGNGWLLDGPEEVLQAEACSTTEDGAEPLLCPSGYECHILIPGDMAEGIPNRGQCVRQRRQADGRFLRRKFYKEYPDGDSKYVAEPGRNNRGPSNKAPGSFLVTAELHLTSEVDASLCPRGPKPEATLGADSPFQALASPMSLSLLCLAPLPPNDAIRATGRGGLRHPAARQQFLAAYFVPGILGGQDSEQMWPSPFLADRGATDSPVSWSK